MLDENHIIILYFAIFQDYKHVAEINYNINPLSAEFFYIAFTVRVAQRVNGCVMLFQCKKVTLTLFE